MNNLPIQQVRKIKGLLYVSIYKMLLKLSSSLKAINYSNKLIFIYWLLQSENLVYLYNKKKATLIIKTIKCFKKCLFVQQSGLKQFGIFTKNKYIVESC